MPRAPDADAAIGPRYERADETLISLLAEAQAGSIQVPEFQRNLVLRDEWIKSLLGSVTQGYPIGAMTLLETGSPTTRFAVHHVPGTPAPVAQPERLLLDGQHRIAALYQVLASDRAVQTEHEGGPAPRWYSVDMKALGTNDDRDDAILSATDLQPEAADWDACRFPLRLVFGRDAELARWKHGYLDHSNGNRDRETRRLVMARFQAEVLPALLQYVIPTTTVSRDMSRWAVRVHGGPEGRSLSDRFHVKDA